VLDVDAVLHRVREQQLVLEDARDVVLVQRVAEREHVGDGVAGGVGEAVEIEEIERPRRAERAVLLLAAVEDEARESLDRLRPGHLGEHEPRGARKARRVVEVERTAEDAGVLDVEIRVRVRGALVEISDELLFAQVDRIGRIHRQEVLDLAADVERLRLCARGALPRAHERERQRGRRDRAKERKRARLSTHTRFRPLRRRRPAPT
jgi:hypothetical protein